MSETGVFVLETKGPEYRVSDVIPYKDVLTRLDSETWKWDYDPEKIKLNFAGRPNYPSKEMALNMAGRIYVLSSRNPEWGILVVDNWKHLTFGEMVNDKRKAEDAQTAPS